MDCKNCRHYHFYEMITNGPYYYSGKIPCLTCSRFSPSQDNFESAPLEKEILEFLKNAVPGDKEK